MRHFSFPLRILKSLQQFYTGLFILEEHQTGILNKRISPTVPSKIEWRIKKVLPAFVIFFLVPSLYLLSQNRPVTGTVIDESGAPVPGVSIILKGTSTGTSSDDAGKFTISAPSKGILVLSNVGFDNKEVPVRE